MSFFKPQFIFGKPQKAQQRDSAFASAQATSDQEEINNKVRDILAKAPQYSNSLDFSEFNNLKNQAFGSGPLDAFERQRQLEKTEAQRALENQTSEGASQVQNAYSQLAQGGLSSGARERVGMGGAQSNIFARQGLRNQDILSNLDINAREGTARSSMQDQITKAITAENNRKADAEMNAYKLKAETEAGLAKATAERAAAASSAANACFAPGTMIEMSDGTEKAIHEIKLGDHVRDGGIVYAIQAARAPKKLYHYAGRVFVTGSHAVFEGDEWKRVEGATLSVPIETEIETVYNFACEGHRIVSGGLMFSDLHETDYSDRISDEESIDMLNGHLIINEDAECFTPNT